MTYSVICVSPAAGQVCPRSSSLHVVSQPEPQTFPQPGPGQTAVLSDGFEATSLAWDAFARNGNGEYWGRTTCVRLNGSAGAWCNEIGAFSRCPQSSYENGMDAWMVRCVDLPPSSVFTLLEFYFRNNVNNGDFLSYLVSVDGMNYYGYHSSTNTSTNWSRRALDLANVPGLGDIGGATRIWIAFRFTSDLANRDNGTNIDDVRLFARPNRVPVCVPGGPYVSECTPDTTRIVLNGSGSYDPDPEDSLIFSWSTNCPGAAFVNPASPRPTLLLATPIGANISCSVTLQVSDGQFSQTCETVVQVDCRNRPPICNVGGPYAEPCQGLTTAIQLDGSASSDSDGDPLFFAWSAPSCPGATFDDPTIANPRLTLDTPPGVPRVCDVVLLVGDGREAVTCTTTVFVTPCPDMNLPPDCDIGGPYVATCRATSTSVQLDGRRSADPNPEDDLTFAWRSDCPGAVFDNPVSATPVLTLSTATCPSTCTVYLTVQDESSVAVACSTTVTLTPRCDESHGGNVVVSCDDADDITGGHCRDARCGGLYSILLQRLLDASTSGGQGILAIGVHDGTTARSALDGWNQRGPGAEVHAVVDPLEIRQVRFEDYKLIYVPSSVEATRGGITQNELDALAFRKEDLQCFVNAGGSLLALVELGLDRAFSWLPLSLNFTSDDFVSVYPTTLMEPVAPDATAGNMSHHEYHCFFTGPSGYSGLEALARKAPVHRQPNEPGVHQPAILGGSGVIIGTEDCNNGMDDDGDGRIDCADDECRRAENCYESSCQNGIDDDNDGATDCDDTDCEGDPYCLGGCPAGSLQTVMDGYFGEGCIDVAVDKQAEVFLGYGFQFILVDRCQRGDQSVGWYPLSDPAEFNVIFGPDDPAGSQVDLVIPVPQFGLAYRSRESEQFLSQPASNPGGQDHFRTFDVCADFGAMVVGVEDGSGGGDGSFNDYVVYFRASPVPVAVEDLTATATGRQVVVSWRHPESVLTDLAQVFVERATALQGPFERRAGLQAERILSFTDDNVELDKSYWYRLVLQTRNGMESIGGWVRVFVGADPVREPALHVESDPNNAAAVRIRYSIPRSAAPTRLGIYSIGGTLVRSLDGAGKESGEHVITWNRKDHGGRRVARGVYFAHLQVGGKTIGKKFVIAQ